MTIAILAHDSRKELALQFCTAYSAILSKNTVIATGTTGRMLAQTTGLPVHCYLSGKLGGVQQITSRVACDEVDLVLFFRDPLKADASSITEQNLLRLCDMHGVPIATNIATAEVLLRGLDQGDLDYREGMHCLLYTSLQASSTSPVPAVSWISFWAHTFPRAARALSACPLPSLIRRPASWRAASVPLWKTAASSPIPVPTSTTCAPSTAA